MNEKIEMGEKPEEVLCFEEGLAKLKSIGQAMQEEEALDRSLALYKQAKALSLHLQKLLDQAELEITTLEGESVSVELDKKDEA